MGIADDIAAGLIVMAAVVLFAFGVLVLAIGAYWFATAVRQAATAYDHLVRAHSDNEAITDARSALTEAQEVVKRRAYQPQSEDALLEAIYAERGSTNGKSHGVEQDEYYADRNAGLEDEPTFSGGMYVKPNEPPPEPIL